MNRVCPACGIVVETADRVPGQAIRCPGCARLIVPASEPLTPDQARAGVSPPTSWQESAEVDLVALGLADPWDAPRQTGVDARGDEGTTTRLLENRRQERIKRGIEPPDPADLIGEAGVGPSRSRGRGPSAAGIEPAREPWFYRFLEFSANALIVFFLVGTLALASIPVMLLNELLGVNGMVEGYGWRLLGPGVVLVLVLVCLLFNVAVILLIVDAARNLRAINQRLARGESADPRR